MDIIQFINSIGYSNFESTVTTFFDENMALYNLVGGYSADFHINGEVVEDGSSIRFILDFKSKKDAKKMYDIISDKYIIIFNKRFDINETLIGPQIIVEFN